jgi:hypothetical protein
MAGGRVPVLLCFERPNDPGKWCHRSLAVQWLAEALGVTVPEFSLILDLWRRPCRQMRLRRARLADTMNAAASSWPFSRSNVGSHARQLTRVQPIAPVDQQAIGIEAAGTGSVG